MFSKTEARALKEAVIQFLTVEALAAVGKIETFNYLLDKGADPYMVSWFGENLMHYASHGGNVTILQKIISRGLHIDSRGRYGNTPLMKAAASGKIEAVNFLLEKELIPLR